MRSPSHHGHSCDVQPRRPRASRRRSARALAALLIAMAALIVGSAGGVLLTHYWLTGRWNPLPTGDGMQQTGASIDDAATQLYTCGMHPTVIQQQPGDCPICHMQLTPMKQDVENEDATASRMERKVLYWRAPMDPAYISRTPGKSPMGMDLVPVFASESATGRTISIDPVTIQNMGIRTAIVRRGPLTKTIRTVGRVDYDEQTVAFIDTKFDGWIEKLHVNETGVAVERGEPLFEVYSPKLYSAQEEYLAALRGAQRLANSSLAEAREESHRLVEASEVQLRYFDVSDEQITELRRTGQIRKTLTIHSPAKGIVTEKMALAGMYVKPGMRLFTIADLSRVWVYVDIYEYQLPWVSVGQHATMTLSYIPGRHFDGRVVYVYPYLDQQTRVVKVRLEFENLSGELKPEMYAGVVLQADLDRNALLVPREAYIDSGTRRVAFVARGGGKFQPRDIEVGVEAEDGSVEVTEGLDAGERVVVSGQFMLDAESKLKEAVAKMRERGSDQATERRSDEGKEPGTVAGAPKDQHAIPPDAQFACPMDTHPDETDPSKQGAFFASKAGRCDWCGMALKPLDKLDWVRARRAAGEAEVAYTCPDHPHVYSEAAGRCARCGKQLEPFKVMYTCPDPSHAGVISASADRCPEDGQPLAPYRALWLSQHMANRNVPTSPAVANAADFHCPVHPLVRSAGPGRCPICAAELEVRDTVADSQNSPVEPPTDAKFVCPMHAAQVRSDNPGACPTCGMRLVAADSLQVPATAPAAVTLQMDYLFEHYLELHKRLASDSSDGVAMQALGLVGAVDEIIEQLNHPDIDLPDEFATAARRLRAAAVQMTGENLEADRVTFVALGNAMRVLVDHVRPNTSRYPKIYIYHCPMTKGDWLQAHDQMANPFYGFKMLKCGEPQAIK